MIYQKKKTKWGTSEGLMRGVLARFKELGYAIGGFNGYMTSDVLQGSGGLHQQPLKL